MQTVTEAAKATKMAVTVSENHVEYVRTAQPTPRMNGPLFE